MIQIVNSAMQIPDNERVIGVQGDNLAQKRVFTINKVVNGLDLSTYTPLMQLQAIYPTHPPYFDILTTSISGDSLILTWNISSHDMNSKGNLYFQIQFSKVLGSDVIVYQTLKDLFVVAPTIEARAEYENMTPAVFEQYIKRAKTEADRAESIASGLTGRVDVAINNANTQAAFTKGVGDDLNRRLAAGEFKGEKGDGLNLAGSKNTLAELNAAFPNGDGVNTYLIGTDVYVWNGTAWINGGRFQGKSAYEQAVSGGYTGTEVQFIAELNDIASEQTLTAHTTDLSLHAVTLTHTKIATAHNLVGTLPTSGIISANFQATADFLANETFSVNSVSYSAKPNGEELALPDKAFIVGDLVNVTIDIGGKKLGFKLGGGNAKFNIFPQIEQPTAENGIWVKTNKEILNTIVTQFNDISAEGTWRNIAPSLDRRTGSGGATIGSVIYCIGGASSAGICGLNQAYDTQTDMWSTKAAMPTARRELAVSSVGTNIYCNCGDFNSTLHKKNEVYDTQTNLWSTKVSVHGSLTSATSCAVGKIIYLLGGYTSGNINENQAYDTQTDMWSTKAPMPIGNAGLAAVAVNSIIYAMGGVGNRTANYAYDTVSNLWSAKTTLSTGTYSAGACNIGTIVYLIGGYGTECNNSAYDTITNLWNSKSQMKANRPSRPVVSAIGTNVYALCGETSGITAELYSLYGTTYPNKTMIVQQGEKFANKTKLFVDKKIVIDAYINQCYYHNGTTLEIVPSAINLNGMGWKNII